MTRLKFTIAVFLACSLSTAGGFWFGFREALSLGVMADTLPRGVIAMQQLAALRSGKTQNLATALEFNVDDGLVRGHDLFAHPLRPFFGPLWGFEVHPDFEKYAVRLANYRKTHASPMSKEFLQHMPSKSAEDKAALAEAAEGARLYEFKLRMMVERYASTSESPAAQTEFNRDGSPAADPAGKR